MADRYSLGPGGADRKIQNIVAAVVILLALLVLIFQNNLEDWWQQLQPDSRPAIATIENLTNGVRYRLPESLNYRRARNHMNLHAKDTVATDPDSTAVITFKTGLKVELEPNSLMIVEDYGADGSGKLELTFLQGNVKILNQAQGIHLKGVDISKNDIKKEPSIKIDMAMLEQTPAPTPVPASVAKGNLEDLKEKLRAKNVKKVLSKETLPDSYIASVIRNQRTFLNRCYAQHLRLNPDARGRIDTSLTIEPDGSISTARVVGSTIADPTLEQCVVATLQRARFKAFNGDPIIVQYPINFE